MCTHVRSLITILWANNYFAIVFLHENVEILPYRGHVAMGVLLLINMLSTCVLYELQLEMSNNVVCANGKGSDQPVGTRSLIRAFASPLNIL